MVKARILVSACFLQKGYKYDGGINFCEKIDKLADKYEFVLVCPERFGGLPTPRIPSERLDSKVINIQKDDVTSFFELGAQKTLLLAKENKCQIALLKARSPSCGKGIIYDGTFSHTKKEGNGYTTDLLLKNGIKVYNEDEIEELI